MNRCVIHDKTDCSPLLNGCSYLTSRGGVMTDLIDDPKQWWVSHANVALMARWMADNGYTADQVAYAVEKPWKHTDMFLKAKAPLEAVNGG